VGLALRAGLSSIGARLAYSHLNPGRLGEPSPTSRRLLT